MRTHPAVVKTAPYAPKKRRQAWIATAATISLALLFSGHALVPQALAAQGSTFASERAYDPPTFSADVARILQGSCQGCHRPEGIGPMPLLTYDQVRPFASLIRDRVESRYMPPWHINKAVGIREYENDISLTDEEIQTILAWVDGGAPEGDPADLPPAREWPDVRNWTLEEEFGPPDLIVRSTPYTVAPNGQDQWWSPQVDFEGLEEERWIRAVEFKPAFPLGRQVVHHGHASLLQEGEGARGRVALAHYGVGQAWQIYPEGTGMRVPAGPGKIVWDLHYFPIGEVVENDVTSVGVWFYPPENKPPVASRGERQFMIDGTNLTGQRARDLIIPPYGRLVLEGTQVLERPALIHSFRPHMHMRGTGMTMEAIRPDGRRDLLIEVDKYNHFWQISYRFADHVAPLLPAGTVLLFHSMFDNTENNPINPDPGVWVGFGKRGVDEMSHAWIGLTYLDEQEYMRLVAEREAAKGEAVAGDGG